MAAAYPVTNEQIRYRGITNEQVVDSGTNAFSVYVNTLLDNIAYQLGNTGLSELFPVIGSVTTILDLFPNYYNEVRTYKDWTLGIKLSEEKVVQLSWVNVAGNIYLGAQTQFSTIRYTSILQSLFKQPVVDTSGFLYYRTDHYQSPEAIARQHFNDTYVERIDSYEILDYNISSQF